MKSYDVKKNQTVLITGASAGIGREFARIFARNGFDLVLTSRNQERLDMLAGDLEKAHGIMAAVIAKDLSCNNSPIELFDEVEKRDISIDILVNNAGFGAIGCFGTDTNIKDELEMMQLNMVSLVHLTKLFLPLMIQKKGGRILNVASVAAFQPGPLMAIYFATKAFVLSFSMALGAELSASDIVVSALCPGPVHTEFGNRMGAGFTKEPRYKKLVKISARQVALAGYRGLMAGKQVVVPGAIFKIIIFIERFMPRAWLTRMIKRSQEVLWKKAQDKSSYR